MAELILDGLNYGLMGSMAYRSTLAGYPDGTALRTLLCENIRLIFRPCALNTYQYPVDRHHAIERARSMSPSVVLADEAIRRLRPTTS